MNGLLDGEAVAYRLLRKTSPLLAWLSEEPSRLGWAGRHLRAVSWTILKLAREQHGGNDNDNWSGERSE